MIAWQVETLTKQKLTSNFKHRKISNVESCRSHRFERCNIRPGLDPESDNLAAPELPFDDHVPPESRMPELMLLMQDESLPKLQQHDQKLDHSADYLVWILTRKKHYVK